MRKRDWPMKRSDSPPSGTRSDPLMESLRQQGGRVHPELESLLALQDRDVAVTQCDARLAALAPEALVLDEKLAVAERALEQAGAAIQAAQGRRGELEGKIASYRTMQEQRRQRLEWVRGAKEASTLMAELDLARSVLAKEEAEFMRSGDAVGEAERKAAEAERALERAVRERDAAARAVSAAMLARYERIRRGKAPLALFALHGGSCGNCFTAVPTQRRALIQRAATIEACEACGALLYAKE